MRRIALLLIAVCLAVMLMMNTALAAGNGKAIQLGAGDTTLGAIEGYSNGLHHYLYFGQWNGSPILWRVLDDQTSFGREGLFLMSEFLLDEAQFESSSQSGARSWQGSDAQAWCADFADGAFSAAERSAVMATPKSDRAYTFAQDDYSIDFAEVGSVLSGDKVFLLSAEEVDNPGYGFVSNADRVDTHGAFNPWWLRSMTTGALAGAVDNRGMVVGVSTGDRNTFMRPAFNLHPHHAYFISAAAGGKPESVGLQEVLDYTDWVWKLTLMDGRGTLRTEESRITAKPGESASIRYSGAKTGENEYISAIVSDSAPNALYYGRLAESQGSGTATFTIPHDMPLGQYTLRVFSEQCNGDYMTDYAGNPRFVELTVADPSVLDITAQPQDQSVGQNQPATFAITARGDGLTYQWYCYDSGWQPIDGATQSSYTIPAAGMDSNGLRYKCVATDQKGNSAHSEAALLTVTLHVPDTGDGSQPMLYLSLLLASGLGLMLMRRKRIHI